MLQELQKRKKKTNVGGELQRGSGRPPRGGLTGEEKGGRRGGGKNTSREESFNGLKSKKRGTGATTRRQT